jgi:hypothetical protein
MVFGHVEPSLEHLAYFVSESRLPKHQLVSRTSTIEKDLVPTYMHNNNDPAPLVTEEFSRHVHHEQMHRLHREFKQRRQAKCAFFISQHSTLHSTPVPTPLKNKTRSAMTGLVNLILANLDANSCLSHLIETRMVHETSVKSISVWRPPCVKLMGANHGTTELAHGHME